jgi:hypothetical protein
MAFEPFFAAGVSPLVWARLYSHTDRRCIFSTLTAPSADQHPAPVPLPKDGAMLLRVSTFPLAADHPSVLRGEQHRALALKGVKGALTPDHYVFFGAVWHPNKPTWLRIATRALALPGDADVYAEMMAETKPGSVPVLLERVATV